MKKTGELLRKAREEKGLSLHEIGLSLKISSKVLKAIEDGDDPNLPAKTFLRGFVQSYANFLHLNTDEILKLFHEEMGSTKPKPYIRAVESDPQTTSNDLNTSENTIEASVTPIRKLAPATSNNDSLKSLHEKKNTKTIAITILGFALIGLIIFTKKMIDKYSKEAEVPTAEVEQTIKGVTPVVSETSPVSEANQPTGSSDPLTSLTGGTTEATVSPQQATPPAVSPTQGPPPVVAPTPTSPSPTTSPAQQIPKSVPTSESTPKANVTATTTPPVAKPSSKPEETSKPVELIVEALDAVEIEYAAPNGKPQKIKLSAEQVHTFKSKSGLKINFSNGGAVNLIHNGKDIGIPGDLGKPIKLSY